MGAFSNSSTYAVIKNADYKPPVVGTLEQQEEAKQEESEEEVEVEPIDIEKYTEEEDKQRDIQFNQERPKHVW